MNLHVHRLLERQEVYFTVASPCDSQRFIAIFRDTWRQIPLGNRRCLLKFWRQRGGLDPMTPFILSGPLWWFDNWDEESLVQAQCRRGGAELMFDPYVIDHAPDQLLAQIIAHELYHVVQAATCPEVLVGLEATADDFWHEAECMAREEVDITWGFEVDEDAPEIVAFENAFRAHRAAIRREVRS